MVSAGTREILPARSRRRHGWAAGFLFRDVNGIRPGSHWFAAPDPVTLRQEACDWKSQARRRAPSADEDSAGGHDRRRTAVGGVADCPRSRRDAVRGARARGRRGAHEIDRCARARGVPGVHRRRRRHHRNGAELSRAGRAGGPWRRSSARMGRDGCWRTHSPRRRTDCVLLPGPAHSTASASRSQRRGAGCSPTFAAR